MRRLVVLALLLVSVAAAQSTVRAAFLPGVQGGSPGHPPDPDSGNPQSDVRVGRRPLDGEILRREPLRPSSSSDRGQPRRRAGGLYLSSTGRDPRLRETRRRVRGLSSILRARGTRDRNLSRREGRGA
jgi:hypothetical protein